MPLTPSAKPESAVARDGITGLLRRSAAGDQGAESELIDAIYEDLRRCAQRQLGNGGPVTGPPTAIVHDLYLKLLRENPQIWPDRRYFFAAFARAVHDRLVDGVRRRQRRGRQEPLSELAAAAGELSDEEILSLRECLQRLESVQPRAAEVLRYHYFLGLSIPEVAAVLDVGHATVERDLRFARAWLHARLRG